MRFRAVRMEGGRRVRTSERAARRGFFAVLVGGGVWWARVISGSRWERARVVRMVERVDVEFEGIVVGMRIAGWEALLGASSLFPVSFCSKLPFWCALSSGMIFVVRSRRPCSSRAVLTVLTCCLGTIKTTLLSAGSVSSIS